MQNQWLNNDQYVDDEIVDRWEKSNLLQICSTFDEKRKLATILENQHLANNKYSDDIQFNRISIPLCVRIFKKFIDQGISIRTSKKCSSAQCLLISTPLYMTSVNKFNRLWEQYDLNEEAVQVAKLADDIFIHLQSKSNIGFYCLLNTTPKLVDVIYSEN